MSLLRKVECDALSELILSGAVVDLGGEKRSDYRQICKGDFSLTTVNLLTDAEPDIVADLERPLPLADRTYDAALLLNVLEHIFEYRQLLLETRRILKPGGMAVVVVPFMFPYHASPHDYHRFTGEALRRELVNAGFIDLNIRALGSGVFAVRYNSLERLMPSYLQRLIAPFIYRCVTVVDSVFTRVARMLHKKYHPSDYALGFFVTARVPR